MKYRVNLNYKGQNQPVRNSTVNIRPDSNQFQNSSARNSTVSGRSDSNQFQNQLLPEHTRNVSIHQSVNVVVSDPYTGKTFNGYFVEKPLNRGAFGSVYLVKQHK